MEDTMQINNNSNSLVANKKILVIDEYAKAKIIANYLSPFGYNVEIANIDNIILKGINHNEYDMFIMQLNLSQINVLDMCKDLRKFTDIPIIIISSVVEEVDKIVALEIGVDDFMVEPIFNRELLARIRTIFRRCSSRSNSVSQQIITMDGFEISRASRQVILSGKMIKLTPKEFELLWLFASNFGKVYSRDDLLKYVWSLSDASNDIKDIRTVDQHIKRLRRKINILESKYRVGTIWGVGYKLEIAK